MTLLSIVVPCYNEQETVELFYEALSRVLTTMPLEHEVLFVNDGSTDTTFQKLKGIYDAHPGEIKIINFSRNFGKEAAFLAGLRASKGDLVTVMDADLQDPPEMLPKMLETMAKNNDDIVGSRRVTRAGEPKIRSFFARNFYKIVNHYIEVEIVDGARDFRLMKRNVVDAILTMNEYNRFSKGLFVWVGFQSEYLEYENVERVAGETKWSFWALFRYALDGIIEFTNAPLHFSFWLGSFLTVVMTISLIVLLVRALLGVTISSMTVLLTCVLFFGGIILLVMGILGEYLAKTYGEVKGRPHYIVKDFYE